MVLVSAISFIIKNFVSVTSDTTMQPYCNHEKYEYNDVSGI